MSCGKQSEEVIGRSVEGNEEVLTVRKTCHHNPAEDFETIQTIRRPIPQPEKEVEFKPIIKEEVKQDLFRDDLMRAPRIKK